MESNGNQQGYEDNRFENTVSSNFYCSICLNVLKEPVMCRRNQHYFCISCITRHLGNSPTCPTCMEELTVETLTQVPRIVTDYLSELNIRCDYFSRGCREFVQLGNLATHVTNCGFSPVKCSNDGCGKVLNKQDKTHHEAEVCDFRKLKCHDCAELRREVDEIKVDIAAMRVNITAIKEELHVVATQPDRFIKCVHQMQEEMMKEIRGVRREIKDLEDGIATAKKTVQEPSLPKSKGDIIIAGGEILRRFSYCEDSVELFSWSNKSWALLNPMIKPRSKASSFVYESQMVVTGGIIFNDYDDDHDDDDDDDSSTDSIERMKIQDKPGHWMDFPVNLPEEMYSHKVVCYEDRLILIGGNEERKISDAIYEIELVPPYSKKVVSRMPQPRCRHGVELVKDKIFIVGGRSTGSKILSNVLMYDINKNECKEMSHLPLAMKEMATVVWKDTVIVIGGEDEKGKCLNSVIMYDVNTRKCKMLPSMKYKRRACTAVVTGDVIVVMGGIDDGRNTLNSVECFHLIRQVWEELTSMIESRSYATAVVKLI